MDIFLYTLCLITTIKTVVAVNALFTQDILTHNIAIKRYCNKNIFLGPWMSTGQGKLLTKKSIKAHKQNTNQGMFFREFTLVGQ